MNVLKETGGFILDLLYPRRCPVCHGPAPAGEKICPECRRKLPLVPGKRCAKCGKPVHEFENLCDDCRKIEHVYTRGIGVYLYNDLMRESIVQMKYKGRREYGEILGALAGEEARPLLEAWRPEAVIPIPLHRERLRKRTYNQAEAIASPVAEMLGVPMFPGGLVRLSGTGAMKELSAAERAKNLADALKADEKLPVFRRVLLVDDIYTTGATMDAAAKALIKHGIPEIYFLAVCIGGGYMVNY